MGLKVSSYGFGRFPSWARKVGTHRRRRRGQVSWDARGYDKIEARIKEESVNNRHHSRMGVRGGRAWRYWLFA